LLLQTWPREVADPLARENPQRARHDARRRAHHRRGAGVYFASSGVDSLRIALNRAYDVSETRSFWLLKLESIAYVLVAAVALLALGFLIVLGAARLRDRGEIRAVARLQEQQFTYTRYAIAGTVIVIAIVVAHKWLPAGRRSFRDIAPGVIVTLVLWLAAGILFGRYLAEFANNYVTMYAGLASAMIALVFLYWTATIFVYGGELNAAILHQRARRIAEEEAARAAAAAEAALRQQGLFQKTMRWLGYEKRGR
jgi:membrane protein